MKGICKKAIGYVDSLRIKIRAMRWYYFRPKFRCYTRISCSQEPTCLLRARKTRWYKRHKQLRVSIHSFYPLVLRQSDDDTYLACDHPSSRAPFELASRQTLRMRTCHRGARVSSLFTAYLVNNVNNLKCDSPRDRYIRLPGSVRK